MGHQLTETKALSQKKNKTSGGWWGWGRGSLLLRHQLQAKGGPQDSRVRVPPPHCVSWIHMT